MDVRVRNLAARQHDLAATWQLRDLGLTRKSIEHAAVRLGWRIVHPGVYCLTNAPLSREQRWVAATLSAPATFLSHASAGACWGFRPSESPFETVVRAGSGGPRRMGDLLVFRSTTLAGETTRFKGVAITTGARALIDLAPDLTPFERGKAFREAIRLGATDAGRLREALDRHRGARGTKDLRALVDRYGHLPYRKCLSDGEGLGLEVLHDGGVRPPEVNRPIGGFKADLSWPDALLIIEIDGPQWHLFTDEDRRREERWRSLGFTVERIPSPEVYSHPERLLALANVHLTPL